MLVAGHCDPLGRLRTASSVVFVRPLVAFCVDYRQVVTLGKSYPTPPVSVRVQFLPNPSASAGGKVFDIHGGYVTLVLQVIAGNP